MNASSLKSYYKEPKQLVQLSQPYLFFKDRK